MRKTVIISAIFLALAVMPIFGAADNQPLRQVETLAPPLKFGPWIDLMASSGERNYEVSVEVTNDAAVQVYGEVKFTNVEGKDQTITFSDGAPAKFKTGNFYATIQVRIKTGGPTGGGARISQR